MKRKQLRRGIYLVLTAILVAVGCYAGPPLWALVKRLGLFERWDPVPYEASNENNLKALRIALLNYHDSEGQFPDSAGWMDAIKNRIRAENMLESEAEKKLVNPLLPARPGVFGYAMNDAAGAKYKGDLKDPKMPLVFDSTDTAWNAHGNPKKLIPKNLRQGGEEAITLDGTILKM